MSYDFSITGPDRVISGIGALSQLPEALARLGVTRALLITGRTLATKTDLVARVEETLGASHAGTFSDCVQHVPESSVGKAHEIAIDTDADDWWCSAAVARLIPPSWW